jgi:hypothetical protein
MVGGLSVRRRSRDVSGSQGSGRTSLALLFFFFSVLGFELRALCLLIVLLFFSQQLTLMRTMALIHSEVVDQ